MWLESVTWFLENPNYSTQKSKKKIIPFPIKHDTNGNDGMQVKMFQDTLKEGNIILCLNMVVKLSKRLT